MSDVPWWEAAKAESLERRAAAAVAASGVQAGDAFLIVTEGEVSEPIYFELLRQDLQLPTVRIRVEPGSASHPFHVIATAAKEVREHAERARKGRLANTDPKAFDHVWAVIDTDVATREGRWSAVEQAARAANVNLAYSTPCFEFWLLLHIQGYTTRADLINGDAAKHAVKEALGVDYSTNSSVALESLKLLIGKWPEAVVYGERVRKYHYEGATKLPANPSTEVCRLVRAMNDSAPSHLRKIKD